MRAETKVKVVILPQASIRVGLFLTHPVQYHVCLWRGLADQGSLEVQVFYFSDQGVANRVDPGFSQVVSWDVPLLEGYQYRFLRRCSIDRVSRATIPTVNKFLAQERFDVVYLHGYTHSFARQLVRRRRRFGYRVVLRGEFCDMPRPDRTWWKVWLKEIYLRRFYRQVDHFCPIGCEATDHLLRRGITQERMTVTPYSVDDQLIERQRLKFDRSEMRQDMGVADEQVVFLFSGKLIPRKQPLLLAEAAARLASDPRLVVVYVGSGQLQGRIEERLRPVLGARLHLPGFVNQSELGRYYAAADVFVLPSVFDTWGLVVNEAMHWGLPCIVSDQVGCRRDLVIEGRNGWIVRWNSAEELKERMGCYLSQPSLAATMGRAALHHIEGFRSRVAIERLGAAFRQVTVQPLSRPAVRKAIQ